MLESKVHQFLRSPQTFTIQSLDNRFTTLSINFAPNKSASFGAVKEFLGHLTSSIKTNTECYLQQESSVFPSFDSFLYYPQPGFSPLIGVQVINAANHAINLKGLEKIQKSLKSELKDLRPTKANRMIVLFVVPFTSGPPFVKQTIKDAVKLGRGHWYEKTAQYVLTVSERAVFEATS